MSASVARLSARVVADYLNGGHRTNLIPDLNAIADVAELMDTLYNQTLASANAAAASYALMQALGASAYGVGLDPMKLPRAGDLGSNAMRDWEVASGRFTLICDSSYQITPHDHQKLLLCTSGTRTWTLALSSDAPDGFECFYHNISGNNMTIQRSGSTDTINGIATTSVTIATGAAIGRIVKRTGSTIYHIG